MKPNCYECKWRKEIGYSSHSECGHPKLEGINKVLALAGFMHGLDPLNMGVTGTRHGIENGWFMWPMNFDPTWLMSCAGYERKEVNTLCEKQNAVTESLQSAKQSVQQSAKQ